MKKIFIFSVFLFVAFIFIAYKEASAANVCSFPRGGATYSGYGGVCLGPADYEDAIAAHGIGGLPGLCAVLQDDSQAASGIYTYRSEGPRGITCTLVVRPNGESCSCSDGSSCLNGADLSNVMSVTPWNFAECSKCTNSEFQANWNQTAGSVTINASAENWRPIMERKCFNLQGGEVPPANCQPQHTWDSFVQLPASYLDFKFQVFESGNITPIKEENVFPDSATPTNMNCVYHDVNTRPAYVNRYSTTLDHYTTCVISNYQITGITFQSGKTYTIKTFVKPHYADDTQWIDYIPDGTPTGKDFNICNSSLSIPDITLTPTPTGMPVCEDLTTQNQPTLGSTFQMTCQKNASYTNPVTYDFRLIHKASVQSVDPSPIPTPFVQDSTNALAEYLLPENQYGYYLFQCRVCAGSYCTDWQNPGSAVLPTATPTLANP